LLLDKDPGLPRETQPDPKKGALFLERACEADIGDACHRLSNMYINGFKGAVEVIQFLNLNDMFHPFFCPPPHPVVKHSLDKIVICCVI